MKRIVWMLGICAMALAGKVQAQDQPSAPAAADVVKAAQTKAGKEHKNVLLMFHASWCHWCHAMDTAIADPACKAFFDRSYVLEHLTVSESPKKKNLENPGAEAMLNKFTDGKESGIPFWVIMDPKGKILADSRLPQSGDNMGCPTAGPEVERLKEILKKTGKGSADEITAIGERFKQAAK